MLGKITAFFSKVGIEEMTVKKMPKRFHQRKSNAGTAPEYFGVILLLIGTHEDAAVMINSARYPGAASCA
jgi:hypothetical protein